ncbi:helix-turn-helix transcriptional regulator [Hymenobacter sublimis]|uniref:Helix-turn-helix domain-containing protein n=1 Tax=Hymenobacter sublimis TaxID=2933777 RepID=A0ABY4JI23_9BACT|nr:helix-turn-helix transcriptional regulator [Hymenobacter sublimis]UPL51386.1 helix-turn-helix domain-containing protein [Hymenobacter sublimis]
MNWYSLSDLAILRELGSSLRQMRVNRNQSQQSVADSAGIDRATLSQVEHGRPTSLLTFIQLLRTLEHLELLEPLVTKAEVNPVTLARLTQKQRRNAYPTAPDSTTPPPAEW